MSTRMRYEVRGLDWASDTLYEPGELGDPVIYEAAIIADVMSFLAEERIVGTVRVDELVGDSGGWPVVTIATDRFYDAIRVVSIYFESAPDDVDIATIVPVHV